MDTLTAINTRRSIRKFKPDKIKKDQIDLILKAGMMAPNAHNQQLWQFIVIDDREIIDKIADFHPYAKMLYEAQLVIIVCADLSREQSEGSFSQDCSVAMQNILLAAHAIGLGAVYVSLYPKEDRMNFIRDLIKAPDHIIPFNLTPIGYPNEKTREVDRYDDSKIHYNHW